MDSRHAKEALDIIDSCLLSLPQIDWSRAQVEIENLLLDTRNLIAEIELLERIEQDIRSIKRRKFLL